MAFRVREFLSSQSRLSVPKAVLRDVWGYQRFNKRCFDAREAGLGLDSLDVRWTGIDPLAFANKGDQRPFCDLLIYISVIPQPLVYDDAVAASASVGEILEHLNAVL